MSPLESEQPQLPQLFIIRKVLLDELCHPVLNLLQELHVSSVLSRTGQAWGSFLTPPFLHLTVGFLVSG